MFMHPYISHEIALARQRDLLQRASRQRPAGRLRAGPGTTRRHGGRDLVSALAAVAALVLVVALAGCSGGHGGVTGGGVGKGSGGAVLADQVTPVGIWIGPVPGDEKECGPGSGEFIFAPDGVYQFDAIYDSGQCGYEDKGTYQVQGNFIFFQPEDASGFWEGYGFDDGDLMLCDYPDTAQCYYYQPMQ